MVMVVVMIMVPVIVIVRVSTMNFFQLFKFEVTHGCLQCLSGDANVRWARNCNVRVHAKPSRLAANERPGLGYVAVAKPAGQARRTAR